MKMVSKTSVRRLGLPPNATRKSSRYYRGAIRARPASAQNNKDLANHKNGHSCATNVQQLMEFAFAHPTEVVLLLKKFHNLYLFRFAS